MVVLNSLILWILGINVSIVRGYNGVPDKPNYIIFYVENIDQIAPDLQSPVIREELTNLNSLIQQSFNYRNVYGEASSSSTFGALFTGKPAVDIGIIRGKLLPFDNFPSLASSGGLSTKEPNLASILSAQGYKTSFYGYWKMGFGPQGVNNPMAHGFDTWFGVAYPHNEWCQHNKNSNQEPSAFSQQYLKLFYHTSFLWFLLFLILTVLAYIKLVTFHLYLNLLAYTISTAISFCILLHLFIVQRTASCVLYKDNDIHLQPYDMNNLTLHFTNEANKFLLQQQQHSPFMMVVNYLKMMPPYIHANHFAHERSRPRHSALMELNWSIGYLLETMKELELFEETIIVLTGGNSCSKRNTNQMLKGFQKSQNGGFEEIVVDDSSINCFKIPLWIKEVDYYQKSSFVVDDVIPIHHILDTIIEASHIKETNKSFLKLHRDEDEEEEKRKCPAMSQQFRQLHLTKEALKKFGNIPNDIIFVNNTSLGGAEEIVTRYKAPPIFHYVDIQKPVLVTLGDGSQVIYYHYDTELKSLKKLDRPIIIPHRKVLRDSKEELPNYLRDVLQKTKILIKKHLAERQTINLWSSQFEMPVFPWLLPCSNFPRCRKVWSHYEDFQHLFVRHFD